MSEKILNMSGDFHLEFDAYQAPANNIGGMLATTMECNTFGTCTNLECSTIMC
ncbi:MULTISPECIES: hypothetical protein [Pseudomonas]|jgi:hypothetical protein|uniref:hypothetical protein n=1 Tax=Pseudomonas TaxID=286 RepID=UPI000D78EA37|nr:MULTISPECIES: hypothetical protein [Pseudomonas]MCD9118958.1 hypothetical protein [Pseudomonas bijieensis]PWJ28840.1 hypothetical protein ATJ40_12097 [Pseudomonas sp. 43mfcvi1.1]UQI30410.1 hypothetical protein M3M50_26395 [Pseudomonas bijieensis]WLH62167.1 hypothetical protein PSH86_26245 [Pseudomonas sp. FP2300]SSB99779.1 hypothetical protein SAMN04488697_12097 [Pseudomonas sp. 43mfcvi1.1]